MTVSVTRTSGRIGCTRPMEAASNVEAVAPTTEKAYSFGAAHTARLNATAAAAAIPSPGGSTQSMTAAIAAPTTVPASRLIVRMNTEAYSGRTITATVNGNQNPCAGRFSATVT